MVSPPSHRSAATVATANRLNQIHLCTGILERAGRILLVASRYPNHAEPLWNLPGGRQHPSELLHATLQREFAEETGLDVTPGPLLYVSESYDGQTQFTNVTFSVTATGKPHLVGGDAHVVAVEWVPIAQIPQKISVRVVREPLAAFLAGGTSGYYGYAEAGISIDFAD